MSNRWRNSSILALLMAGIATGWALARRLGREKQTTPSPSQAPVEPAPPPPAPAPTGTPVPPSHPAWGILTLAAVFPVFYFVLALWYRWLRPDPEFLNFTAGVAQLVALISLLGLQTE